MQSRQTFHECPAMPSLSFTFGKIKMPSAKGGLLGSYFICYGDPSTGCSSEGLEVMVQLNRPAMAGKGSWPVGIGQTQGVPPTLTP